MFIITRENLSILRIVEQQQPLQIQEFSFQYILFCL